jgi:hypothetical protein
MHGPSYKIRVYVIITYVPVNGAVSSSERLVLNGWFINE